MARPTVEERFWDKVQGDDPERCWIWTAARDQAGYGHFGVNRKMVRSHRWAYENLRGPIDPTWLTLDHLCNNPPCVNPWHLEPVTMFINIRRSALRGRHWTNRRTKRLPRIESGEVVEAPYWPNASGESHPDYGVYVATPDGVAWYSTHDYHKIQPGEAVYVTGGGTET